MMNEKCWQRYAPSRSARSVGDLAISPTAPADSRWQLLDALWIVEASYLPQTEEVGLRLYEIYEQSRVQGNLFVMLIAGADCANRAFMRGHLRESEKIVYQVLQYALAQRGKLPEPASIALITLSHIYRMRNELAEAHQLVQRATAVDPNPTSSNMPINIAIARAKLQATSGITRKPLPPFRQHALCRRSALLAAGATRIWPCIEAMF
jgi:hypothetical protein